MHFGEPRRRPGILPAIAVVAVTAAAACGGDAGDEPATATGRFGQLHTGVCDAAQLSAAGDRARADEAFEDVHFGLHALVQAVEREDRPAAARLLEAIERTESEGTASSLEDLTDRVAEGIERTGGTAPETCP